MRPSSSIVRLARTARARAYIPQRAASTLMKMPAMSPTMTEGGIAGWKKAEGEAFAAGDVLLEIETDKATIDVEAQDDGVLGKILAQAGSQKIPVGQPIAVLAEEGDDLANLEVPADEAAAAAPTQEKSKATSEEPDKDAGAAFKREEAKQADDANRQEAQGHASATDTKHEHKTIKHAKPLFPSVQRLLAESSLSSAQIEALKGSGKDGMLTKGDVLVALGKLKNPWGSAEKLTIDVLGPSGKRASESKATSPAAAPAKGEPLDAAAIRRLIVAGLSRASTPAVAIVNQAVTPLPRSLDKDFDDILAPYAALLPAPQPAVTIPDLAALASKSTPADEYAGLY
ncbi:pyridoxine biosynthesis protein [Cryptotrichosporon argae]